MLETGEVEELKFFNYGTAGGRTVYVVVVPWGSFCLGKKSHYVTVPHIRHVHPPLLLCSCSKKGQQQTPNFQTFLF